MRKLTKYEQRCWRLSKKIPPLTDTQREWSHRQLPAFRVMYRRRLYCSECGGDTDGLLICPHCGTLFLENDTFRACHKIVSRTYYYGIETTVGGEQVRRHFIVTKTGGIGKRAVFTECEVSRVFINEKGKEAVIAIDTRPTPYIFDSWIEGSDMKVRRKNRHNGYSYIDYRMHIEDYILYPRMRIAPWLKKRGYSRVPQNYDSLAWKEMLISDPFCEWIAKKGHIEYLDHIRLDKLKECRREIMLADRHGYKIEDIGLWVDMVLMYRDCGKDTLNAKWSRPADLKEAHDHATRLDQRRRKIEERQKQLAKERAYNEQKRAYFGILLSSGDITASVIKSAAELVEEGKAMHHCVGTYVDSRDSLIFSVRGADGKRLATVEWSISGKKVVQCRGKCNSRPERYSEIVRLINGGRRKIIAAGKGKAV